MTDKTQPHDAATHNHPKEKHNERHNSSCPQTAKARHEATRPCGEAGTCLKHNAMHIFVINRTKV